MGTLKEQIIDNLDSLPETMQAEILDFVEFLRAKAERNHSVISPEPNGVAMARIMERMAVRNALSEIKDPSAWQRDIRQDRPLPGREA